VQSHSVLFSVYVSLSGALSSSPICREQPSCKSCSLYALVLPSSNTVELRLSQKGVRCWHSGCPLTAALKAVMAQGDTSNGKTITKLRLVRGKMQRTDTKRPSGCHLKAKPLFVLKVCEKGCLSFSSCQLSAPRHLARGEAAGLEQVLASALSHTRR